MSSSLPFTLFYKDVVSDYYKTKMFPFFIKTDQDYSSNLLQPIQGETVVNEEYQILTIFKLYCRCCLCFIFPGPQ